jgi:hypothetical protein
MTCAETRRQLPEPEPGLLADCTQHLEDCGPCRSELDSLRQVDRRLHRLGEARKAAAQAALSMLRSGSSGERRAKERRALESPRLLPPPSPSPHREARSENGLTRSPAPARRRVTRLHQESSSQLRLADHLGAVRGFISVSIATLIPLGLFWLLWRLFHLRAGRLH